MLKKYMGLLQDKGDFQIDHLLVTLVYTLVFSLQYCCECCDN